ncbi:MAG: response regulator [Planctomycetaceae bacterium]|jgi:putative two-component system response regulator|nr:response regulator [Planctomycetaceae bacterium]
MSATRAMVAIVDDNIANLKIAKSALTDSYNVFTLPSAAKLFDFLERNIPALILLDIDMPEMSGYEVIKILKDRPETRDIPVIFLTGISNSDSEIEGLDLGAVDYISKPFLPPLLHKRVNLHLTVGEQKKELESQTRTLTQQSLELQNFNDNLRQIVEVKTGQVLKLQRAILKTVSDLVESRDEETGGHIERTQRWLSFLIGGLRELGIHREQIDDWDTDLILQSSQLHDVGKIAIRDSILMKPGRLTPEEFDEMKKHAAYGVFIIKKIEENAPESDFLKHAEIFAGTHHEKWDGTGYPQGLSGEDIPLLGRLMAIADVYDALISDRPYKKRFSHEEAVRIIMESKGTQFDPVLTDVFEQTADEFRCTEDTDKV